MTMIRLHAPVATSDRLERLRLFPGRHLGEDELDRVQAYVDERLAPLLANSRPGILHGLQVDLPAQGVRGAGCSVRAGLAVAGNGRVVGLYYPTQATWRGLMEGWHLQASSLQAEGGGCHHQRRRVPCPHVQHSWRG